MGKTQAGNERSHQDGDTVSPAMRVFLEHKYLIIQRDLTSLSRKGQLLPSVNKSIRFLRVDLCRGDGAKYEVTQEGPGEGERKRKEGKQGGQRGSPR